MRRLAFGLLLAALAAPVCAQPITARLDPQIAAHVGALDADSVEASVRRLAAFGTRHTLSDTVSETSGIGAARRWIERAMRGYGGRLKVTTQRFIQPADGRRIPRDVEIVNVLATLPGTDPADDRVFIVSGHYDSRVTEANNATDYAPGASDDASGTAAVMEMARVLADAEFPATLIFAAVGAEEQGLFGAAHMAMIADSLGWNVAGMLTLDIVGNTLGDNGRRDNRTVRIFSEGVPSAETELQARIRRATGGENDSPSRQLARYVEEVGERYVPYMDVKLIYRRDRFLRGGDHIPFNERGVAAARLSEPNEAFTRQHQDVRQEDGIAYGDVPDAADFAYTADVARLALAAFTTAASAPPPPRQPGIWASGLTVDTRLLWQPPSGGSNRLAGYYVLMRETTASRWERKVFVPAGETEITLPGFSKDDFFFAIQSVSEGGHESLIQFPPPIFR